MAKWVNLTGKLNGEWTVKPPMAEKAATSRNSLRAAMTECLLMCVCVCADRPEEPFLCDCVCAPHFLKDRRQLEMERPSERSKKALRGMRSRQIECCTTDP